MIMGVLVLIVVAAALFFLRSYLVMLTWGMVVDNVELFEGLSTLSFVEALIVTLFLTVAFSFTANASSSDG